MKRYFITVLVSFLWITNVKTEAQRFTAATNFLDYACLGTMNLECAYSVSRCWNLTFDLRYNPFTFRKGLPDQFQLRQRSCGLGVRFWPWHTWSGWWFAGKARYQEYNFGGIRSSQTEEGDRAGLGLYAGYTYMLSPDFNLEFGLGVWGGHDRFSRYACQNCGLTEVSGQRWFILPDDIKIALVYVF